MKKNCLLMLGFCALNSLGAVVYENATSYKELFNDSRLENGDEIVLAGTARQLTEFSFEYFGSFAEQGDEKARLRFYLNDGAAGENPFATPGSLLYDSGDFTISSGFKTVTVNALNLFLPADSFTWSVEFTGIASTEQAGLLFYDPPTVGSSDDYFWQKENGAWLAVASDGTGNNFAAQVLAVEGLRIASLTRQGASAELRVTGATADAVYSLQFKETVTGAWQDVPGQAAAVGGEVTLVDAGASAARHRFYRVVEVSNAPAPGANIEFSSAE